MALLIKNVWQYKVFGKVVKSAQDGSVINEYGPTNFGPW